ncbi:hypothetical protein P9E76_15570 [Schinkia azotoformans]|uniref:hypothetical protein n=1 Tax=Schinkia azotoformans TaxID=1454 RepID=UPI0002E4C085|nr:hypothetical protein [Schinkia azotoformans]MEC1638103.1 hypothetical protein [Schinkia azotoformans]MEC1946463.1 hypothetical protein [Schinkia azotoformans]
MIKQQEVKVKEQKKTKNKEDEIIIECYFLGEFTLDDYYQKQVNLILAKFK